MIHKRILLISLIFALCYNVKASAMEAFMKMLPSSSICTKETADCAQLIVGNYTFILMRTNPHRGTIIATFDRIIFDENGTECLFREQLSSETATKYLRILSKKLDSGNVFIAIAKELGIIPKSNL